MSEIDLTRLAEPFPAKDIEWRIGQCGAGREGKLWAKVLAYITNRAIMERLDAVCGPENWRNEFKEWTVGGQAGVLCGISIQVPDGAFGQQWVTKWDGAENTDIEAVKGGLSGAMKRAAVQWGIGRYLYDLEEGWAVIVEDNRDKQAHFAKTKEGTSFYWKPPALPVWALPALHAPPPADSRAANTLSPAEQDRARQANPQPPAKVHATKQQQKGLATLADELGLTAHQKAEALRRQGLRRIGYLAEKDVDAFALELHRVAVEGLMADTQTALSDVRVEDSSVAADVPGELTLEQAQAALVVLQACKERMLVG